ncbi:MAG: M23 family metallopeptidase [Ignavibacteria bacterium]|nr:M23 family metallopeptidase [Ignavibacteria bacterium]
MKSLYYFSPTKLKFVEAKNILPIVISLFIIFTLIFSGTLFGIYYVFNPESQVYILKSRNNTLKKELILLRERYTEFSNELKKLADKNNELRLAVNLEPITLEDRNIGIGGSIFEFMQPSNANEFSVFVSMIKEDVENITTKLNFEQENYAVIKRKLEQNQKLFDALPAIKPIEAAYSDDFGMRIHPILKIPKMHYGLDFVANIGTPVYAPGGGKVIFAGSKPGLGRTVEIDHGFGYKTVFGHLSEFNVTTEQNIKRGYLIAKSGNSGGYSTGPHLHYEVRHNGIALNPQNFIFDDINIFKNSELQKNPI